MKKKSGYILLVTMGIATVMLILAFSYVNFYASQKGLNQSSEQWQIAKTAAFSGIADGLYQLKRNQSWNTGFQNIGLPHSGATYSLTFTPGSTPYSTNNINGTLPVTGYNGRVVPPSMVHLVSIGNYNGTMQVEEALLWWHSVFTNGVSTDKTISIVGNTMTDSYDSSKGSYGQTHQNSGGDMRTNSGGTDTVQIKGNASVDGTITVGPGGSSSSINTSGGATYVQPGIIATDTVAMPFISPPSGQNNGNLTSSVTLSSGVYVYNSINLSGNSSLQVTGPVTIYVLGNISISGNTKINDILKIPGNLNIIGGPQTTSVSITGLGSGSSGAYFTLYAPAANVNISGNGNSALYGSVVSSSLSISGGTAIHFDQSLKNSTVRVFNYQAYWK